MLYNGAEAAGIVGHDAVDTGPNQSTEVATVVNRPDNEAQARPGWARGIDRIAPPQFCHEKITPRLHGHDRFSPEGKARACHLIAVDGRRPCAQIYELGSLRIEGNFHACMRGLVPALRFVTQLVKDRLILREEHGFVQGAISLQGLHGVLEERWHEVGAILRNFEIEKQEPSAVILAQSLDKLGEREDRDALPSVLIAIVPPTRGAALHGWAGPAVDGADCIPRWDVVHF